MQKRQKKKTRKELKGKWIMQYVCITWWILVKRACHRQQDKNLKKCRRRRATDRGSLQINIIIWRCNAEGDKDFGVGGRGKRRGRGGREGVGEDEGWLGYNPRSTPPLCGRGRGWSTPQDIMLQKLEIFYKFLGSPRSWVGWGEGEGWLTMWSIQTGFLLPVLVSWKFRRFLASLLKCRVFNRLFCACWKAPWQGGGRGVGGTLSVVPLCVCEEGIPGVDKLCLTNPGTSGSLERVCEGCNLLTWRTYISTYTEGPFRENISLDKNLYLEDGQVHKEQSFLFYFYPF